jgi:hypothetical protein
MRRLAAVAAVVLAVTLVTTAPPLSAATGGPSIAVTASAADDAARASREARVLRRETAALLAGYLTEYDDRFTPAENDELIGYRAAADRTLAGVVVTTKRLQSLLAAGATRSQVLTAGRAAQRAHARARAAAEASYDGARRIMEPRLSLFEGIAAIREYDAMLRRFDDLGDRIDSVVSAARR